MGWMVVSSSPAWGGRAWLHSVKGLQWGGRSGGWLLLVLGPGRRITPAFPRWDGGFLTGWCKLCVFRAFGDDNVHVYLLE